MSNELREAVVHFELYRFLMNTISFRKQFDTIRYIAVEPEVRVDGGSADLVVKAELNGSPTHFLVVEVKKRTELGLPIFDDDARDQAKKYATALSALYYAITDGQRLRLFRVPSEYIGDYALPQDEGTGKQLLKGLSDLHAGIISKLPFNAVKDPREVIIEQSTGFTKMLDGLFNELSGKRGIVKRIHGKVVFLSIRQHKGVLRLGLSEDPSKTYIDIRLEMLRKAVGLGKFADVIKKLSEVSGFQWVHNKIYSEEPNTWRYIKNLVTEEPDRDNAREGLRRWILELDGILK